MLKRFAVSSVACRSHFYAGAIKSNTRCISVELIKKLRLMQILEKPQHHPRTRQFKKMTLASLQSLITGERV